MKTFTKMAAQGDFIIIRIDEFPAKKLEKISPVDGKIIVAHSETGHNHVMECEYVEAYKEADTSEVNFYEMFLNVKEPTEINHLRSFDTHETLQVPPGNYLIKRQREYTPEGFRKAQD
jgi:hypothetical protein